LEIGQVSAQIKEIKSVHEIMEELTEGFKKAKNNLNNFDF
jgi:flagellin-specific chaperone FliS